MSAMNDGAAIGDGHIVGVIHEMWLKESDTLRDGGAHPVFESTENASSAADSSSKRGGPHPIFNGSKRQMLVAGGKDLQERKRLLVDKADALVVLPGGPGTWDELWEMACAKGIGLSNLPIVCVSVDGYYEPFAHMLQRAYDDQLTKLQPHEIVHFVDSAVEAVKWVEAVHNGTAKAPKRKPEMPKRSMSVLHNPVVGRSSFRSKSSSRYSESSDAVEPDLLPWIAPALTFAAGVALGALIVYKSQR